jgi:hypothetical protein
MDLAWVLLIQIRSLFLFSCSPVLWFFLIVFLPAILYMFFCATLFFALFCSFFPCVSFSFLFERRRGRRHLEGGTCDRVTLPRPRDLSVDTSCTLLDPRLRLPPACPSQRPAQGTPAYSNDRRFLPFSIALGSSRVREGGNHPVSL